jgi:hypothetical protein
MLSNTGLAGDRFDFGGELLLAMIRDASAMTNGVSMKRMFRKS